MVTVRPFPGTNPAKETVPAAGARTLEPESPAISMPRCWPPAYGSSPSEKERITWPSAGQVQLAAGATMTIAANEAARVSTIERRI